MRLSSSAIYMMVHDWCWVNCPHNQHPKEQKEWEKNLFVSQLFDKDPFICMDNTATFCHVLLGEPQVDHKELINQLRVYIQKHKEGN